MSEKHPAGGREGGHEPEHEADDRPVDEVSLASQGSGQDRQPAPDAGEAETPGPIIPGNVGSLDDVPADVEGVPVDEE